MQPWHAFVLFFLLLAMLVFAGCTGFPHPTPLRPGDFSDPAWLEALPDPKGKTP